VKRKGFHWASEQELVHDHFDLDVAFRRDPLGLCQAVGAALNEQLRNEPIMKDWDWALEWTNLPGAISVMVTGTARNPEKVECPGFVAATSVAEYNEVDDAAERLKHRILRFIGAWKTE
jgi:hypothetical protein